MMAPDAPMPELAVRAEEVRAHAPAEAGQQVEGDEAELAEQHLERRARR